MIRAAVVQAAPVVFDLSATLEKVRALTADAASQRPSFPAIPKDSTSARASGRGR
jgi:predicted amidohydrolase